MVIENDVALLRRRYIYMHIYTYNIDEPMYIHVRRTNTYKHTHKHTHMHA